MATKRALTGIRASGNPHVGNYLGAIKPAIGFQNSCECFFFIADMHSLTTNKNPADLRERALDVAATWLALGLDPKRSIIYRQSDVPYTSELAWYLSCCTGMGLLEKGHSYKDALAQSKEVNHGVFAYPVLMAADILLYESDLVPVGKDQKQHVEMARDMAGSFNALYGEVLKLPEPFIREEVMTIPGLDGRKMSKSYGNEVPIFIDEAGLKKLIMGIKTDSTALEAPKTMEKTLLGELFKHFGSREAYADLEGRLQRGGLGWGHAKLELFEALNTFLKPFRGSYNEVRSDTALLERILADGAARAFAVALPVLDRAREAVGFGKFRYRLPG